MRSIMGGPAIVLALLCRCKKDGDNGTLTTCDGLQRVADDLVHCGPCCHIHEQDTRLACQDGVDEGCLACRENEKRNNAHGVRRAITSGSAVHATARLPQS